MLMCIVDAHRQVWSTLQYYHDNRWTEPQDVVQHRNFLSHRVPLSEYGNCILCTVWLGYRNVTGVLEHAELIRGAVMQILKADIRVYGLVEELASGPLPSWNPLPTVLILNKVLFLRV